MNLVGEIGINIWLFLLTLSRRLCISLHPTPPACSYNHCITSGEPVGPFSLQTCPSGPWNCLVSLLLQFWGPTGCWSRTTSPCPITEDVTPVHLGTTHPFRFVILSLVSWGLYLVYSRFRGNQNWSRASFFTAPHYVSVVIAGRHAVIQIALLEWPFALSWTSSTLEGPGTIAEVPSSWEEVAIPDL